MQSYDSLHRRSVRLIQSNKFSRSFGLPQIVKVQQLMFFYSNELVSIKNNNLDLIII